jgi:CubicO group peptidase (beta-lactamase class C family)
MHKVYLRKLMLTKATAVALFLCFYAAAAAQNPSFTSKDSTRNNSGRTEPNKNNAEEKLKQELEKKKLAGIVEEEIAKGILPMATAIQEFPPGTPSFIRDSLDSYIRRGMELWQIPGLAIAIVKDGKVILSKGYGVAEKDRSSIVDENTLFIIASNTKLFTGTALAKLDHEKKLSLNDRISKYIPWFRLYDTTSTRLANIRDMLCHRIGLKTFQGDFTFWDSNLAKDSIIWKMRYLKPSGEFRQDYGYCNSAFLVAGRVLEKVTGGSWEKYVTDNILTPLGMTNTYMNTDKLPLRSNVAQPHNNLYGPLTTIPFDNVDNLGPATSMVSNVKDLSKWIMLQLDSGRYGGKQVLPWQVLQKTRDINILTGSRKSLYYPTHFRGYGLGVYSTDYSGRQVYWHTGGAFGHVSNVCFVPEEKLGITILTNNDNQNFFEALRYQLLDAYLDVAYTDRSKFLWGFYVPAKKESDDSVASMKARVEKNNVPGIKLDDFTGNYYNTIYGRISISKQGNGLLCRFQRHPELFGYMDYMDNNEFRMTYSNIGYGIYPAKFSLKNGKPFGIQIQVNDFVESDAYLFVKNPKGTVLK